MTRIVVVETEGLGGLIQWAYQFCNALAGEGADVTLLTSKHYELRRLPHHFAADATLPMWANVERESAWVTRLPWAVRLLRHRMRRWLRAIRLMMVWMQLSRRLLESRPDIV